MNTAHSGPIYQDISLTHSSVRLHDAFPCPYIIIIIIIMDLKYANYFKFKENKNQGAREIYQWLQTK